MSAYDSEEVNLLCEDINLLEYASKSYDFVKIDSHNYACHCPRHIDKTPSLMIDDDGNYFYCFSCGVSGNLISWLMVFENLSYGDAVKKVVELTGADLGTLRVSDSVLFYRQLHSEKHTRIINRKILSPSYYEQFDDDIPVEWVNEGISVDVLKKYEIRIDKRANRIVYPVYDNNYNLIGVKGRTRFDNYKMLGIQKYMNYCPIGSVDYFGGMKQAEEYVRNSGKIIVFEGIKSAMKMDTWGYHNCVSTETSHINTEQINLLIKMGLKEVVIAYDKDVDVKKINLGMLRRFTNVFGIVDKHNLLGDKDSPVDKGKNIWEQLYNERVRL